MCIVVLSCADFSDLWSNNLSLFDKYWKNHPALFLVSDGIGKHNLISPPNLRIYSGDMSDRIIQAIRELDYEYILLTFDDYFLRHQVDNDRISDLILEMSNADIDYCGLFKRPRLKGKKISAFGYKIIPLNKVYQVNFYPCIWKKASLLKVIKNGEDIWKTEVRLTRRSRENNLHCVTIGKNHLFSFVDIVRKGKYLISGRRFIKRHDLYLSNRKTRSIKETVFLGAKTIGSRALPNFMKRSIKTSLRKKGHTIYSDYENTDD